MAVKYSGHLSQLEVGQVIKISGKTIVDSDRFEIDFANAHGIHDSGDVPFHLSVRFLEAGGVIVRNSYTRGQGWDHEERHENLFPNAQANPIRRGTDFKIAIYVDSKMFFVTIDDKPYCTFLHRKPLHAIQRINISRDVETIYQVDHITAQPNRWPKRSNSVFSGLVPKQFTAGSVIAVTGIPRGNRGDFVLNLRDGSSKILFHLRPNLGSETVVVNDKDADGRLFNLLISSINENFRTLGSMVQLIQK